MGAARTDCRPRPPWLHPKLISDGSPKRPRVWVIVKAPRLDVLFRQEAMAVRGVMGLGWSKSINKVVVRALDITGVCDT